MRAESTGIATHEACGADASTPVSWLCKMASELNNFALPRLKGSDPPAHQNAKTSSNNAMTAEH